MPHSSLLFWLHHCVQLKCAIFTRSDALVRWEIVLTPTKKSFPNFKKIPQLVWMTSRPFKASKKQPVSLTPSLVCINMPLPDTIISIPSNIICNNLISIHRDKYVWERGLKIVDRKGNDMKLSGSCQAWCVLTQPAWLTGKHLDKIPCPIATENLHSQGIRALCGEECQVSWLVREGTKMP